MTFNRIIFGCLLWLCITCWFFWDIQRICQFIITNFIIWLCLLLLNLSSHSFGLNYHFYFIFWLKWNCSIDGCISMFFCCGAMTKRGIETFSGINGSCLKWLIRCCVRVHFILGVLPMALSTWGIPKLLVVVFETLGGFSSISPAAWNNVSSIICLFVWFCSRSVDVLHLLGNGAWSNKVGIAFSFNSLQDLISRSSPLKWKIRTIQIL